jgi:RAB protein geranylgeranyltransferase component A
VNDRASSSSDASPPIGRRAFALARGREPTVRHIARAMPANDARGDEFDLPKSCDVLIVGTALPQAVLAAAIARRGERVVCLDAGTSYGDAFGAFAATTPARGLFASDAIDGENAWETFGTCVDAKTGRVDETASRRLRRSANEDANAPARGYSIDLNAPRLALGADGFVETLVRSGAHKYLEFKAIERTFVYADGVARAVASNRSDVFKDRGLSGGEKRALMRFLKAVHVEAMRDATGRRRSGKSGEETNVAVGAPGSEWGGDEFQTTKDDDDAEGLRVENGETMDAFLTRHGLSASLRAAVTYALALQTRADCAAATALEDLKVYILIVAKYGPQTGACLIPVYGAGDIPQAFCRVGAVDGATYVLRQGVRELDASTTISAAISTGGQEIRARKFIVPAPERSSGPLLVHAVCILDAPLVAEYGQMLVVFPPLSAADAQTAVIRALQVGSHTGCCPEGKYLLYLSTVVDDVNVDPYAGLNAALDVLVRRGEVSSTASAFGADVEKPEVLWGTMYKRRCGHLDDIECSSSNVAYCPGPDELATFEGALRAAERAYKALFGDDQEMFPLTEGEPKETTGDDDMDAMLED